MSVEAIQWALYLPHPNPTHKAVLVGMANHANPDGKDCFPSIDRLEKYTSLGRSTIIRAIKQMEDLGILSAVRTVGKVTKYTLNFDWQAQDDQCRSGTRPTAGPVPEREEPVPQRDGGSAAAAPEPSLTVINRQSKRGARATRLPPEWTLPSEWWNWASKFGLEAQRIDLEADKFRDYWHGKGGQGAVKADWFATWRNWCRRVVEDERRRGPPKSGRSPLMDEILRRANEPTH